jgi:hypothetical protein
MPYEHQGTTAVAGPVPTARLSRVAQYTRRTRCWSRGAAWTATWWVSDDLGQDVVETDGIVVARLASEVEGRPVVIRTGAEPQARDG